MNKILILSLFLVFACSTKTVIESTPTESDAVVVNPKDIQACYCEKIFMPVCGQDKRNYPNACEAECYGVTKWTEGNCK